MILLAIISANIRSVIILDCFYYSSIQIIKSVDFRKQVNKSYMSNSQLIDLRLHNRVSDQCISIDTPAGKSLGEVTEFLKKVVD